MTRAKSALVLLVFAMVVPATATADPAVPPTAMAGPQAKFYGYLTPVVTIAKGDTLTFSSFDLERHDFVQDVAVDGFGGPTRMPWCDKGNNDGKGEGELCPTFWTKLIGFNDNTKILGLKNLESGTTYSFFCTLHSGMKGKLIVQ
jgi:plastocyanin